MSFRLLTGSLFNKTVGLTDLFHCIAQLTIDIQFSIKKTAQNYSERHFGQPISDQKLFYLG